MSTNPHGIQFQVNGAEMIITGVNETNRQETIQLLQRLGIHEPQVQDGQITVQIKNLVPDPAKPNEVEGTILDLCGPSLDVKNREDHGGRAKG